MSLSALVLAVSLALTAFEPQQAGSAPLPPAQEARVQQLGKQLRCAVCQGLSIGDSPSSMARAQMDKVRSLVAEGRTDPEIRDYFVARYGEWVLLSPPAHGLNWLVWLLPALLVLGGLALIVRTLARPRTPAPPTPPGPASEGADPYLDAVRAELDP